MKTGLGKISSSTKVVCQFPFSKNTSNYYNRFFLYSGRRLTSNMEHHRVLISAFFSLPIGRQWRYILVLFTDKGCPRRRCHRRGHHLVCGVQPRWRAAGHRRQGRPSCHIPGEFDGWVRGGILLIGIRTRVRVRLLLLITSIDWRKEGGSVLLVKWVTTRKEDSINWIFKPGNVFLVWKIEMEMMIDRKRRVPFEGRMHLRGTNWKGCFCKELLKLYKV